MGLIHQSFLQRFCFLNPTNAVDKIEFTNVFLPGTKFIGKNNI